MTIKSALALSLLVLTPALAATEASANSASARQTYQLGEIERGRQTGAITWREGLKLRKEQREIAKVEANLKSDGHLSKRDRRKLNKLQTSANQNIADKATNRWHRAWFMPRFGR